MRGAFLHSAGPSEYRGWTKYLCEFSSFQWFFKENNIDFLTITPQNADDILQKRYDFIIIESYFQWSNLMTELFKSDRRPKVLLFDFCSNALINLSQAAELITPYGQSALTGWMEKCDFVTFMGPSSHYYVPRHRLELYYPIHSDFLQHIRKYKGGMKEYDICTPRVSSYEMLNTTSIVCDELKINALVSIKSHHNVLLNCPRSSRITVVEEDSIPVWNTDKFGEFISSSKIMLRPLDQLAIDIQGVRINHLALELDVPVISTDNIVNRVCAPHLIYDRSIDSLLELIDTTLTKTELALSYVDKEMLYNGGPDGSLFQSLISVKVFR